MIEAWLNKFKTRWETKNVELILDLFSDDVEYWETPYQKIPDKAALKHE